MDHQDWQQQLEEERLRKQLDLCLVVHKHELEGTARELAKELGIDRQFQQEIHAHANTASMGR